ncbi:hypothetical protein TUM12370_24580 [Salmonella enterica subsp. enterica serovar Choleraesuis]|nr:hypothetical protein TUM12370_24580 [Salmonella enterica subsp. enterica serovar Choleraesuis]
MHLTAAAKIYPGVWQAIDRARENGDWPEWCFAPMAEIFPFAISSWDRRPSPVALSADVARLAGLAAWRVTQGIYRFDPIVYQSMIETPTGRLPAEVLTLLPEWGVYVETQNMPDTVGFFAHCEWDHRSNTPELRLLLDTNTGLQPVAIPLTGGTIADAADHIAPGYGEIVAARCADCVALLLYMCSITADFGHYSASRPSPVRTKRGPRLFPPRAPVIVQTGEQLGKVLRASQEGYSSSDNITGKTVAPHLRRAHWHGYWSGTPRRFDIRWMHPILVNETEASPTEILVR